jgi:hypothetical protein
MPQAALLAPSVGRRDLANLHVGVLHQELIRRALIGRRAKRGNCGGCRLSTDRPPSRITCRVVDEHYKRMRERAMLAIADYEEGRIALADLCGALTLAGSALDRAHPRAKEALDGASWGLYVDSHTLSLENHERPLAIERRLTELRRVLAGDG